jgi:hypothetical protein
VEVNFCLGPDVVGWRESKITGETLCKNVGVGYFAPPIDVIQVGDHPALDTTNTENDSQKMNVADERHMHKMAKVHDFLVMWEGSQSLHATQKKLHIENDQVTAVGYISDIEEIVKAAWSLFKHDGVAVF